MIRLIAAIDSTRGVANDKGIPWQGKLPTDAQHYRDQTENGVIVMGYETYTEYDKPLHDRDNYVAARPDSGELKPGFVLVPVLDNFLNEHTNDLVWVIGGAALFGKALKWADELHLTQVDGDFECTKFFPPFAESFSLQSAQVSLTESDITFRFEIWVPTQSVPD
jgi:dihydrofolate reductase